MKLNKLLLTAIPMVGVAAVTPAVLSSCSNAKSLEFGNITLTEGKQTYDEFGITGNFNAGTNYEFIAKMSIWDAKHGKPEDETEWAKVQAFSYVFGCTDGSTFALKNTDNIKIICDGKELKRGTAEEVAAGTAQWTIISTSGAYGQIKIHQTTGGSPITYTSEIKLQNIQFESDVKNFALAFQTTGE